MLHRASDFDGFLHEMKTNLGEIGWGGVDWIGLNH
jgi:hypothetical protein